MDLLGYYARAKTKVTGQAPTTDYREAEYKMAYEKAYGQQRKREEEKRGREEAKKKSGGFLSGFGDMAGNLAANIERENFGGGRRRGGIDDFGFSGMDDYFGVDHKHKKRKHKAKKKGGRPYKVVYYR